MPLTNLTSQNIEKNTISSLSFEKAMEELELIVKKLETGQDSLDNSIELYARGIELKNYCEEKLKEATLKIEKISLSPEGIPILEKFSPPS